MICYVYDVQYCLDLFLMRSFVFRELCHTFQDDEGEIRNISSADSLSKLPKSVKDLVCMIFDVESMKKAMLEFEVCCTGQSSIRKSYHSLYTASLIA